MGAKLWVKFVVGNQPPRFLQMVGSETSKLQNAEQIVAALESIGCESRSSSWLQNPPQLRLCKCCDGEKPRAGFARRQFSRTSPVCKSCAAADQISLQIASRVVVENHKAMTLLPLPRPKIPAPRPQPPSRRDSFVEFVVVHAEEPRASSKKKAKRKKSELKKSGLVPTQAAPVPHGSEASSKGDRADFAVAVAQKPPSSMTAESGLLCGDSVLVQRLQSLGNVQKWWRVCAPLVEVHTAPDNSSPLAPIGGVYQNTYVLERESEGSWICMSSPSSSDPHWVQCTVFSVQDGSSHFWQPSLVAVWRVRDA